jgi:multidrug transporter EmrE-like cation transporter
MSELVNIVILTLFEIFGDFQIQQYVKTNEYEPLLYGIFGYIGVVIYLVKSLREINVLYLNLLWDGISAILETIAAMVILGQRFDSYTHILGAFFIISGLFIIRLK